MPHSPTRKRKRLDLSSRATYSPSPILARSNARVVDKSSRLHFCVCRQASAGKSLTRKGTTPQPSPPPACLPRLAVEFATVSRCRHTRQNSVGDGRGPVAFRKSGEKAHMPFRQWEDPESRLRLRTRPFEKLRCTFAQMLRCRGRSRPR